MRKLLGFLAFIAIAFAAPQINPQGIIVNPLPTNLSVSVWVNKDPGRTGEALYQTGEAMQIYVSVNRQAYVYLFNVNPDGSIDPILPNSYDRQNLLKAGEVRRFPPVGARYQFTVTGPQGSNYVLAVASRELLNVSSILSSGLDRVLVHGLSGLSKALSIVVAPIPEQDWVSSSLRYSVRQSSASSLPPVHTQGTLSIGSSPDGAAIYIDGSYYGATPRSITLRPGRYDLKIQAAGYQVYAAVARVAAGGVTRINARLAPIPKTGILGVTSIPGGAGVFVDGRQVGTAPMRTTLSAGAHTVVLEHQGYQDFSARVQINAGRLSRVDARLVPISSTLRVLGSVNAQVFVDGRLVGHIRNGYLSIQIEPGNHQLVVLAPGYRAYVTEVFTMPGTLSRLQVSLSRL